MKLSDLAALLRHYPLRFGFKLLELRERLVSDRSGNSCGKGAPPPNYLDLYVALKRLDDEHVWEEAEMDETYLYLRMAKGLKIPSEIEPLLPL